MFALQAMLTFVLLLILFHLTAVAAADTSTSSASSSASAALGLAALHIYQQFLASCDRAPVSRDDEPGRAAAEPYTRAALGRAVAGARAAPGQSLRKVAQRFGVPRTTLRDRVHGLHAKVHGRPPLLSPDDERALAQWCDQRSRMNAPVTMREVRHSAALVAAKRGGRKFRNQHASRGWLKSFLRRHPQLVITRARSSHVSLPTPEQWDTWFHTIKVGFRFLSRFELAFSHRRCVCVCVCVCV
nr:hypothetical protein [Pseudomonadota bacterium]